jgi:adenine/guanine/hypoxanthine permease
MENTQMLNQNSVAAEKKQNPVSAFFDKFFHFSERGGSLSSEIGAGIGAFLIAAASFLMNTQIIGSIYGNYAGSYLAITLVAMIGTILLGVLTNRPLVMSANLALSTSMVSLVGAHSGMTYSNLVVLTTIASLIALAISISPLGKKVGEILPVSVRKALPIAVGLLVILEAVNASGIVSDNGFETLTWGGENSLQSIYVVIAVVGILAFIVMKALHVRKTAFRLFGAMIGLMWAFGIIFFNEYFIGGQTATIAVYHRVNTFFTTDGASCYNIGLGFSSVKWGSLFTEGFDFSAVEGAGLVWVKGILIYLVFALFGNVSYLHAAAATGDYIGADAKVEEIQKTLMVVNGVNVVSGAVLAAPMASVSSTSSVLSNDEGKTGLSSIVTGIGFFAMMFTWIVFGLTATGTHGVGMWIELSETKLAAYVQDSFLFADVVMALVGCMMLKGLKNLDFKSPRELAAVIATVVGTLFVKDLGFGIALGVITDVLFSFADKKEEGNAIVKYGSLVVGLAYAVLAMF